MQLAAALHSPSQSSPIGFCSVSTSLPQGYLWVSKLQCPAAAHRVLTSTHGFCSITPWPIGGTTSLNEKYDNNIEKFMDFRSNISSSPQVAGGGGDPSQGQVEIFSLHRNFPRLVKTVSVNAPVLCLEYVKEPCASAEEREAASLQSSAKTGNIICVGLQDGRSHILFIYFLKLYSYFTVSQNQGP